MNIKDSLSKLADKSLFECKWVGDYRLPIMGLAIISVMYCHSTIWAQLDKASFVWRFPDMLFGLVFTGSFLLLSGYGIFFSLSRGGSIASFYKRRLFRVFMPFALISFPFYLYYLTLSECSFSDFFLNITSLYNVVKSNNGMWYITASLIMYALSPFIYDISVKKFRNTCLVFLLVTFGFILLSMIIYYIFPMYSAKTFILWGKLWIFVVGMLIAYAAQNKIGGGYLLLCVTALFLMLCVVRDIFEMGVSFYQLFKEMLATMLVCIIFHSSMKYKITNTAVAFLSWFGMYSLEIYILHMLIYHFLRDLNMTYGYFAHVHPAFLSFSSIAVSVALCAPIHSTISKINNYIERYQTH